MTPARVLARERGLFIGTHLRLESVGPSGGMQLISWEEGGSRAAE